MENKDVNIEQLLSEIESLKSQLYDANSIIDAIKEGSVDALVLHNDGVPQIYSIESADYTYRILIEKFGEGALSISDDGLILYCNDYFSQLAGLPADKITGTYLKAYFNSPDEFDTLMQGIQDGISKSEIVLNVQGKKFPVNISFTDLHPTVAAIGVVVTDLSEKKKHEAALVKYQKQLELKVEELNTTNINLEQFIHVISHDLKEPLRKIIMYTSRMKSDTSGTTGNESNPVEVIRASALRLNSLVDDLVKYAFNSIKDDVTEISLNEVIKEVAEDLEIIINEKNASLEFANLPDIQGARVQMRQLFSNLISNAIKYSSTERRPEIRITCQVVHDRDAEFYKIVISDNGIGMDKAHLGKIFTIFQRLHLRNEYSGNGIGLAICKKIMENHSGRIEVESEPGTGSTFNLYFPKNTL